jgi:2-dehydropantoate 2-reductase
MDSAGGPVVILGAGAVGSYVGGWLAHAGRQVVLVDGWPEHVEAIRRDGLAIVGPDGSIQARPAVWHLGEIHQLRRLAPQAVLLTVKLYDTAWAARLLATWLPAWAPVVTLQNGLVEDLVAQEVGWRRTLGAIGSQLHVALERPGVVRRSRRRRLQAAPVFEVGEAHGRSTPRARRLAALLDEVDEAKVTSDLWNHRWAKLCANAMTSALSGLSGLGVRELLARDDCRQIAIALCAETLTVGRALGFEPTAVFGQSSGTWLAAAAGDREALLAAGAALAHQASTLEEGSLSGTAQDLSKGRPSEVDYLNGYVAREGGRIGVPVQCNAAVAAMVRAAEAGELQTGTDVVVRLASHTAAAG